MESIGQRARFGLEGFLVVVSLVLICLNVHVFGMPDAWLVVATAIFMVYVIMQFWLKLGLTLPFAFIVFWMVVAIKEWNEQQSISSFDLEDYTFAMAAVVNALIGVVIYFENKTRW
ncbi:MAG: hypothetical protein JJ975_14065 [Bacteroidia bacterium]|nr:hypothetical protein [Bacteroidia bacterium]